MTWVISQTRWLVLTLPFFVYLSRKLSSRVVVSQVTFLKLLGDIKHLWMSSCAWGQIDVKCNPLDRSMHLTWSLSISIHPIFKGRQVGRQESHSSLEATLMQSFVLVLWPTCCESHIYECLFSSLAAVAAPLQLRVTSNLCRTSLHTLMAHNSARSALCKREWK